MANNVKPYAQRVKESRELVAKRQNKELLDWIDRFDKGLIFEYLQGTGDYGYDSDVRQEYFFTKKDDDWDWGYQDIFGILKYFFDIAEHERNEWDTTLMIKDALEKIKQNNLSIFLYRFSEILSYGSKVDDYPDSSANNGCLRFCKEEREYVYNMIEYLHSLAITDFPNEEEEKVKLILEFIDKNYKVIYE
jgi:hypothetical protein